LNANFSEHIYERQTTYLSRSADIRDLRVSQAPWLFSRYDRAANLFGQGNHEWIRGIPRALRIHKSGMSIDDYIDPLLKWPVYGHE
jgi:hypothetical protein